ncbi:hypothetical protein LMG26411_04951 [Cupriavidus numazuensis]|uniref:Uncharacterized protein n=1 Tax=Cupriavidus numazuensis TaxID=221992 RepID=A0ABM8TMX9_9BURK|nr:hypothetical protein LMG26411_04951 [Cupriavidus numazuensis]
MNRDASDNLWWESNLYWYGSNRYHGGDSPDTDPNWLIDKIISMNGFVRGATFVSFSGVQYRVALCQ